MLGVASAPSKNSKRRLKHLPGVAGLDEAGRGPLAGPVVAAAVILPKGFDCRGLNDSKQLSPEERTVLAERIKAKSTWSVSFVDVDEIERLNILWASMAAMERAYRSLGAQAERILVDGNKCPRELPHAEWVVKGDATYACIAAASIIAKTERDTHMRALDLQHPGYGFGQHFGYATPEHLEAIDRLGPCAIHRMSFSPFRKDEQLCLTFDE